MPVLQDHLDSEVYETGAELVIRVELPAGVGIRVEGASVAVQDGTLEVRLPRETTDERAAVGGLAGFHPDAPPS